MLCPGEECSRGTPARAQRPPHRNRRWWELCLLEICEASKGGALFIGARKVGPSVEASSTKIIVAAEVGSFEHTVAAEAGPLERDVAAEAGPLERGVAAETNALEKT